MIEQEAREFVAASRWRFAKSMPRIPHFYTLRKDAKSDEEFVAFVLFIRSHGYDDSFFSRTFRYLDLDGWQYWTMGCVKDATILINRAQTGREDVPIQPNPIPLKEKEWPETWCHSTKQLVPKQGELPLD